MSVLYLFTALFPEARGIIRAFHLKKDPESRAFQRFAGDQITLTVTGVGCAAACTAAAETLQHARPGDLLVNAGLAAGRAEPGTIFLINRLTDETSGRTFYPDMVWTSPFPETALHTGNRIADTPPADGLYDMEGAALFQAAGYYLGPDRMLFLKVVSDAGMDHAVTAQKAEEWMSQPALLAFLRKLADRPEEAEVPLNAAQEDAVERLIKGLHSSATMAAEVRQWMTWLALEGEPIEKTITEWFAEGILPCASRQEGKICLGKLRDTVV